MKRVFIFCTIGMILLVGCGRRDEAARAPEPLASVRAESRRALVEVVDANGQRSTLAPLQEQDLTKGEGVDVDEQGHAILKFADLLLVEVLRDGDLTVREFLGGDTGATIVLAQTAGALLGNFNPQKEIDRRLSIDADFVQVEVNGTEFLLVREAQTELWWVIGLDATPNDLRVTGGGTTKDVTTAQARWVAPVGPPSPAFNYDMDNIQSWIDNAQAGQPQPEIGEIVWPQADALSSTEPLDELPPVGESFELEGVRLILDPDGMFGSPTYELDDCNGDGINDIAMQGGKIRFDFRPVLARVRSFDVTIWNRSAPGSGGLVVFDPAYAEMSQQPISAGRDSGEVLALRSAPGLPYHYAELSMADGCFLGFSLTPPEPNGAPAEPRPAADLGEAPPDNGARIVQPSPTPTRRAPTATPTPEPQQCEVVYNGSDGLNLRAGPGLVYEPPLRTLKLGTQLNPLGRSRNSDWLQVEVRANGQIGWVSAGARYVRCNFDIGELPVVQAPPTPTPTDTPTPTITPTPPGARPESQGEIVAPQLLGNWGYDATITIDGDYSDWLALQDQSGVAPTQLQYTILGRDCDARYPDTSADATDLLGYVWTAYDDNYLYVAFIVQDEGYAPYLGDDLQFYRGDSLQLLLDTDLNGDYYEVKANRDDMRIDFSPLGVPGYDYGPRAALWRLSDDEAVPFDEAQIAVGSPSRLTRIRIPGYVLEAALPWKYLNADPAAASRYGFVASITDNDTPGSNEAQCAISTAPDLGWQNPTTWGTLYFKTRRNILELEPFADPPLLLDPSILIATPVPIE